MDEFASTYYKIDYPVRIGSMTIKELEFYYEFGRENIAVESYFTSLFGIKTMSGESIGIYYGELGSLEKDVEKIEEVLEIKVIIPEPYYNC